jgi:predicted  nucleic acid-binding Zn-ribbon protein
MSDQDFQQQVIDRLDRLSTDVATVRTDIETVRADVETVRAEVETVRTDVEELRGEAKQAVSDTEKFNEKFADYRQATQWVVQLSFSLITAATIVTIVSAIFKR